ncbi:RVP_2 domain-containing protein [Cephalotus follicularis]|uniref:RVP_2 domain-containing protein n=1 Tax=Cephalotus follicularis TaxID=3775 RepID=A0A1Q3BFW0_CEPFO|nr:RVP_2 domain-containing protein [Cephalotus follicularis]
MFRPTTMNQAIGLARLQEERIVLKKKLNRPDLRKLTTVTNGASKPPTKRLTLVEAKERRDRGFCLYCDEKFHPGHRCRIPKLFMNDNVSFDTEEVGEEGQEIDMEIEELNEPVHHISLHAITGSLAPLTMRIVGFLNGCSLIFLIDSGSMHNFLSLRAVTWARVPVHQGSVFEVMVANGDWLKGEGRCEGDTLSIQGSPIKTDFCLPTLGGCEAVLGTQWLRTLGPIVWDFQNLSMTF